MISNKLHPAITVLFECEHYIIINKPPGYLSQPNGRQSTTVLKALRSSRPDLFERRAYPFCEPRIVHRLDRPVSGAMILGTSAVGLRMIQKSMRTQGEKGWMVQKEYVAVLEGKVSGPTAGVITLPIDGMPASTYFRIFPGLFGHNNTFARFKLYTGRKHQIRLHAEKTLAPILKMSGDQIALHSYQVSVNTGQEKSPWSTSVSAPIEYDDGSWSPYLDESRGFSLFPAVGDVKITP